MHHTRFLRSSLDTEARQEEENIHMCSGAFTAYYSKQRKKSFWILTIAMFGVSILSTIGGISSFIVSELTATGLICLIVLFFGITLLSFSCIPTISSYRCYVDNDSIKEEYLVLLYKKKKLVLWSDIKYIKIKKAEDNNICSIVFFDCHRKKLLHLSSSVVGLTQIAKKAKRKQIPPYHK